MWNSRVTPHTGAAMGLKCGVVGELTKVIRGTGHEVHDRHVPCRSLVFLSALEEGNLANTFYGEPHNTDWDEPENKIDSNPCVANHRVFSPCMDRPSKAFPDS